MTDDKKTPVVEEKKLDKKDPIIPIVKPYKSEKFAAFLDLLRGEAVYHWVQIANSLGVNQDTITSWKNHPSAQKAIRDGIEKALEGMTIAGKDEWRMWESKLKMLGISPIEKSDITSGGEVISGFNMLPPTKPEEKPKDDPNNKTDKKAV